MIHNSQSDLFTMKNVTSPLHTLKQLPVFLRINYKALPLAFQVLPGSSPTPPLLSVLLISPLIHLFQQLALPFFMSHAHALSFSQALSIFCFLSREFLYFRYLHGSFPHLILLYSRVTFSERSSLIKLCKIEHSSQIH